MSRSAPSDEPIIVDAPTEADWIRIRAARGRAQARVEAIDGVWSMGTRASFREEIGSVVRSASPFLISLLATQGLTLDDAVMMIEPRRGWPRRPDLHYRVYGREARLHPLRHHYASKGLSGESTLRAQGPIIDLPAGGWMRVAVTGHSLEATGTIGPILFDTRFGELRIKLKEALPHSLLIGCIGCLIEKVVDHVALRGRGWRVSAVEDAGLLHQGQMLTVPTGSVAYRMPWVI